MPEADDQGRGLSWSWELDFDALPDRPQDGRIVAWDAPEHYGVACKRVDARADDTKSVFNIRRSMPVALAGVVRDVDADHLAIDIKQWPARVAACRSPRRRDRA